MNILSLNEVAIKTNHVPMQSVQNKTPHYNVSMVFVLLFLTNV